MGGDSPSPNAHPVGDDAVYGRVRGGVGARRRRGGNLRPHEHRDVVRVRAREYWRARAAVYGTGPAAAVQGAVSVAGFRTLGCSLRVHHEGTPGDSLGAVRDLASH